MASLSPHLDEDDFDWEAAVREIDYACQSTVPCATNGGGIAPIPPSIGSYSSADIGDEACPRPAMAICRARQSTLDRYVDKFECENSKLCYQENVAGIYCGRRDASDVGDGVSAVGIDLEAAKTWIYPVNIPLRDYQFAIAKTALFSNTLVALPTGLGKTLIAAVVMYNYFRWFPEGNIVFAAPSRPLVMQQIEACHNIVGIPQEWTIDMTGQMSPPKRSRFWKAKRVFFVTPQVFEKDIQSGICMARQLVCLVFDEAHRAMGNYSYCVAVRELMAMNVQLRILALTATPGSKHQAIQNVIDNLCISTLEYRQESDRDVCPYVHCRKLELIEVPMGKDAIVINSMLLQAIQPFVARLRTIGALPQRDFSTLSPSELLNLRDKFRQAPPHSLPTSKYGEIEASFSILITFYHIRKLLSSHGIRPAYEMLQEKMNHGSFSKLVSKIEAFWKAKHLMQQSLSHGAPTPKMVKLLEILVDHFKTKNPSDSRVIIFSNFRGSVRDIMNYLSNMGDMVKATEFIGQSSGKTLKGQTQKEQQAVLEKFRSGGYNVIVATSIGEEGLDIMEVDLVICFDANVSPLRMIQRMGRTGRKNDGQVVILACEGSELKSYLKKQGSSKAMRKHMHNGGIKNFNFHSSPRMIPHMCIPQVQYLEMSIEEFIPRGKKAKNSSMERSPFSRNLSNEELNLISKYFPRSGDGVWKPSLIAFPSFQTFPSQISTVWHSFKTTSMFINAMQDLQGMSSSEVNDNGFIEVENRSQQLNKLSASRDNIRRDSQVSAGETLKIKVGPHHDAQKPKPHRLLFSKGSVTVNSSGNVFIAYVPALQHKGSKYSEDLPTIHVDDPKGKASTDLQQSNNGAPSSLLVQAIQNEQKNVKYRDSYETLNRKNSDMEYVLPSSVGRSRDEAIEIELSPRLTHFMDEGLVPESPILNIDHHVLTMEKSRFLRHSLDDDKDSRCLTAIRVNSFSSDGLLSESVIDDRNSPIHFNTPNHAGISGMSSKVAISNEVKRAENTIFEVINDNNIAYSIIEAVHTSAGATNEVVHTPKTTKHSSSEDWKCNSGEASTSFFRSHKYKRLCKYKDVVEKLPAKTLHKTFKLVEKTDGGTVNIRDGGLKHSYSEKDKIVRHANGFIEEEAEVSSDVSVSNDEADDEKNDNYDDSFIDDRINPTNGSTEAENSEVDMIAFYRRSLLTQSPAKFTGNYLPTSHESISSATAGSFSPDNKHNLMETPQNCLISFNQADDKNSAICIAAVATTESGEPINHSEKCSNKLESRKRKLIFQPSPSNTILNSNSNLRHETSSQQAERNLHRPSKFAQFDLLPAFDDEFFQDLDLDEVEAQATKLLRCKAELSSGKSQAERVHEHSAQR